MKLKQLGPNRTEVELADGRTIFFSYETPVAAFIPGKGYVVTEEKFSRTTTKHISEWLRRHTGEGNFTCPRVSQSIIEGYASNPGDDDEGEYVVLEPNWNGVYRWGKAGLEAELAALGVLPGWEKPFPVKPKVDRVRTLLAMLVVTIEASSQVHDNRSDLTELLGQVTDEHGGGSFDFSPASVAKQLRTPTLRGVLDVIGDVHKALERDDTEEVTSAISDALDTTSKHKKVPRQQQRLTFAEVKREVTQLGFTLSKNQDGEYRLCPKGGREESAYYTNDLDDVLGTARHWK